MKRQRIPLCRYRAVSIARRNCKSVERLVLVKDTLDCLNESDKEFCGQNLASAHYNEKELDTLPISAAKQKSDHYFVAVQKNRGTGDLQAQETCQLCVSE